MSKYLTHAKSDTNYESEEPMIDESQLDNLKERLESIERLLESFIYRDASFAFKNAQDDPDTAAYKAGRAVEGLLNLFYQRIAEEKGEKISEKPMSIEDLKGGIGKLGGKINPLVLSQINLIQQYRNAGSHSHKETVKSKDINTVLSALLSILEWYLEDIQKETLDFSEIGLKNKEKQYIDFVTMALSDGVISNSEREFLNKKIRELGLSPEKAKLIEEELFLKLGKPIFQEPLLQSQLSKLDSSNFEDFIDKKSLSLEIGKKIQILDRIDFEIFDFSNKEDFSLVLKTIYLGSLEEVYKNINYDKSIDTESESTEEIDSKNINELLLYVVTRYDLLQNYNTISHIQGIKKVNCRLLFSRIKRSLILINKILNLRNL